MSLATGPDLVAMFGAVAAAIEADKARLSELDGAIGDGDHGITMAMGFAAVTSALSKLDPAASDPTLILNTVAKAFLNAVGASSGPLYATAFMRAAASVKGRAALDEPAILGLLLAMAKGIGERGKAEPGDKTMIDAWHPAAQAIEAAQAAGKPFAECLDDAVAAAAAGAEATTTMVARKGRAAKLGDRSLGHMDPGAASAVIVLRAIRDRFSPNGSTAS